MINQLVSIITPCYNSANYIAETIQSVQQQTYTQWEMLIVDDCSTDNSINIIENFIKKDSRIKCFKLTKNSGPAVARNKAIQEAKGQYLAFLDSDDIWYKNKLKKQISFMIENKYDFTFTKYTRVNSSGVTIPSNPYFEQRITYSDMLTSNKIGCLTVMLNRLSIQHLQFPEIKKRQDYALWLKILKQVKIAYGINEPLAYYRIHDSGISVNKFEMLKWNWKIFYKIEKLNLFKSLYYLTQNVYYKLRYK